MKKNIKTPQEEIDFVILWVDGSDPEWKKQKSKYSHDSKDDDRPQRYRDFGMLRYWFRGVEKFAPWVRNIYFVTWGHLPEWLDTLVSDKCSTCEIILEGRRITPINKD